MRKTLLGFCLGILVVSEAVFAADITVTLNFPQKNTKKLGMVKAIQKAEKVSGTIVFDISPYPIVAEGNTTCLVKYFLNEALLYSTDGKNADKPESVSFAYALDTTKYPNGEYKIFINYFDSSGKEAIGIKKIVIMNKTPIEVN